MSKKLRIAFIVLAVLSVLAVVAFSVLTNRASSPKYPEITFDGADIEVKTDAADEELLQNVKATDPEDGDVSDSLIVESISSVAEDHTAKVVYVAFDSANHITKAEQKVKFVDYISPRFSLTQALIFKSTNNLNILKYVTVNDMFDGDISHKAKCSIEGNSTALVNVGEHEIVLRVTNSKGDTVHLPLSVEITDRNPNPAQLTLTDYLVYLPLNSEFDAASYFESYKTTDGIVNSIDNITIEGTVDTHTPGVYTVTYSCSGDSEGRTKLIVVVE